MGALAMLAVRRMNTDRQSTLTLSAISLALLVLAVAMFLNLWGRPVPPSLVPPTPPEFTNTATVRMSAAELFESDGDTSGLGCYTCHDSKKEPVIKFETNGAVILSEMHADIVMQHGRNSRNDHCFICHDPKNLEQLRAHEGQVFKLTESSRLCGSCHGPTYRDWEAGVHGRTVGFWDRKLGEVTRSDCTSCHDPHSPAFAPMQPGPGPNSLHSKSPAPTTTKGE